MRVFCYPAGPLRRGIPSPFCRPSVRHNATGDTGHAKPAGDAAAAPAALLPPQSSGEASPAPDLFPLMEILPAPPSGGVDPPGRPSPSARPLRSPSPPFAPLRADPFDSPGPKANFHAPRGNFRESQGEPARTEIPELYRPGGDGAQDESCNLKHAMTTTASPDSRTVAAGFKPLAGFFSPLTFPALHACAEAVDAALAAERKAFGVGFERDGAPDVWRQCTFAKSPALFEAVARFLSEFKRHRAEDEEDENPSDFLGTMKGDRAAMIRETLLCWDAGNDREDEVKKLQLRHEGRTVYSCPTTAVGYFYAEAARPSVRWSAEHDTNPAQGCEGG